MKIVDTKAFIRNISFPLVACILFSCHKEHETACGDDPIGLPEAFLDISFKDSLTGQYLYTDGSSLYNRDSLQIFDNTGASLPVYFFETPIPVHYMVEVDRVYNGITDQSAFDAELCKSIFIKYNASARDTVQLCFKSILLPPCGSGEFESFKVFYKGQLLRETDSTFGNAVTIARY